MKALEFCKLQKIGSFRLTSSILPLKTHPVIGYSIEDLPQYEEIIRRFKLCGEYAKNNGIRTGSHPGQYVVMSSGDMSLNYYSCSPSLIISPPNKELVLPKIDVAFNISNATLTKILRLASMNNLPNLSVIGKNGEIKLQAHEAKNDTSNFVSTSIDEYVGADFSISFKTENLRLIPDDYNVEIAIGGFSKWSNKSGNLTYYIAMEKK
jgi:hypothetical protein